KALRFAIVGDNAASEQHTAPASAPKDDAGTQETQSAPLAQGAAATGEPEPTVKAAQIPQSLAQTIHVDDIRKGREDNRGETIDLVFFKRPEFAVYQSGGKILVQYADDEALAKEQIAAIAELLPLKDRLQYLAQDMDRPECYQWQIAESLRLGLYGQKD